MSEESPLYASLPTDHNPAPSHTDELIGKYGMPAGYTRIPWSGVVKNQEVYVYGTTLLHPDGHPTISPIGKAHGPHFVVDTVKRVLQNRNGQRYLHYAEDLLVSTLGIQQ